ncbi:hypothetical protein ANANG_G00133960 [Anguilla anguilla]|uniref:NACHT domain-containing protein n=1 Tax=Anguilla anguilla TaxID=7936 RepID=A0A9D3M9P0_ANGAN|nr:hypothetical protein ANANG_G00133960 [Anguilla anguilla]
MMWTSKAKNNVSTKRKENSGVVTFPPIPKSCSNSRQELSDRKPTFQRLQELFFASGPTGLKQEAYHLLDSGLRNKQKAEGHRSVPPLRVNMRAHSQIKAHFRHRLQQLRISHTEQNLKSEETGVDVLSLLKEQSVLLKDKSLGGLLGAGGAESFPGCPPGFLRSLTVLGVGEAAGGVGPDGDGAGLSPVVSPRPGAPSDSLRKRALLGSVSCSKRKSVCEEGRPRSSGCTTSDIIRGNVTLPCCARKRRFMIYICGGYKDTVAERTALVEKAYPPLYVYCKQRGYDLRMLDLRRGVEDAITDRNDTAALHVEALRECQEAQGHLFFLFTGQKHEVQTLPLSMSTEEFEAVLDVLEKEKQDLSKRRQMSLSELGLESQSSFAVSDTSSFASELGQSQTDSAESSTLLSASEVSQNSLTDDEEVGATPLGIRCWADADKDQNLLRMCYRLDENCLPPVYCLLPVSTHFSDMLSTDGARRREAKRAWQSVCVRLWGVLQRNGPGVLGEEQSARLLRTVLASEVEQGLSVQGPPEQHCHWYKRNISDITYNLKSDKASKYIDILKGRPEVNQNLYSCHQRFMESIHTKLRHTNIYELSVGWGRNGLNPETNRSHLFYTERLCSDFRRIVINHLNRHIKVSSMKCSPDVRRRKASRIRMQDEILQHVHRAQELEKHCDYRETVLSDLRRELESSNQRPVLLLGEAGWGKSTTMARVALLASGWVAGDVKVLVRFVGHTGDSRNVRLLLQSLSFQLAEVYADHVRLSEDLPQLVSEFFSLLELVPEDGPVLMVLDGLDELSEEHGSDLSWLLRPFPPHVRLLLSASSDSACAKMLQKSLKPCVVPLPPLSPEDITEALEGRLERDGRRLRDWQWQILRQACLYRHVLSRLEGAHGDRLVRRAASLISLSRNGITEEELLGLLPRDGQVMREVELTHRPSTPPKVPYALWAGLRRDLGELLTEVETDDTLVYRWSHSVLTQVCKQRYMKTPEAQTSVHRDFASYFLSGPDEMDGHVFQPLAWTLETDSARSRVFNLRKLHGLPFHLIRSGQAAPLLSECLFNYEFLLHKVWGLSVLFVEEDLKAGIIVEKELLDVTVLRQALQLSRNILLKDPCQLAAQLSGRLYRIIDEDRPVAPGDPRKFSHLHTLLAQCRSSSFPVLVPSFSCMMPPGGLQYSLLAGHLDGVTALAGGQKGAVAVSCSRDGMLKLWDLELGCAVRTLRGVGGHVDSVTLCMDDAAVALTMKQTLLVLEVASGRVLYTESDSLDVPVVTTTSGGQLLVAFYDGSHLVKVFDLADSCRELCRVTIAMECDPIHKDHTILVSRGSFKDYVLFAYRSGAEAAVLSAAKGELLSTMATHHGAASVQGVELTAEYLLLFCRYPYKRHDNIIHIELFGMQNFQYLRSIYGCSQDYISQLAVNRAGTHVVAFSQSWDTATTEIIAWNIETEDHKHLARCSGLVKGGCCSDMRFCLGICNGEPYLRMWNLALGINDQSLTYNVHKVKSDGIAEVIPMSKYPRYVVCRSLRPGTVRVWNVARSGYRGRPVRVEHGLYDSADVVLARDMKLYILTDRGTASFTEPPMPIFQTLLIYDLLKKSYVKRQSGLYVIPCPQQEYRLLQGELLLGLSETRDHLILWDLESGHIKGRLKVTHRESFLSGSFLDKNSQEIPLRESTALVMPWDRRTETHSAKRRRRERRAQRERETQRRLDREKHNAVDQYLLSGDEQVVVCSYFAHHLVVFSVSSQAHLHTLEDRDSMLFLHAAAVTHSGGHLVLSNYNDAEKASYVTLWDLHKGKVRKRLKNEPGVCCVAVSSSASRIAFGVTGVNRLKVWDPFRRGHKTIPGYESLTVGVSSQLFLTEEGAKAVLLAGEASVWDLDGGTVLSVFRPDSRIQCLSVLGEDSTLLLGLSDSPTLVTLRLTSRGGGPRTPASGEDLFGEQSSSSEDEGEVDRSSQTANR